MVKKLFIIFILLLGNVSYLIAQYWANQMPDIPLMHQRFHDNIDKAQRNILSLKCNKDSVLLATTNIDVNLYLTQFVKNKIDYFQFFIETSSKIDENNKYKWLRGVNDLLSEFIVQYKQKRISIIQVYDLLQCFQKAMELEMENKSILGIINIAPLEVGTILTTNFAFEGNDGIEDSKYVLLYKYCKKNPDNILNVLSKYPNLQNADSLIVEFAYRNPQELYDYAASNTPLGNKIRTIQEPLVNAVTQMASVNEGRFLFPFLDAIMAKKLSIDEIKNSINDYESYFKLLIKTQGFYELLKQEGKNVFSYDALLDKIKAKAIENYITPINALHEENNLSIRFDKIKNLAPQDLYFVTIMGEEEIYTSSFINGVYPKIIDGLAGLKTDSLLKLVHYAYYRKFLKMCASFNMLEDFLSKMDKNISENLLNNFASNLEQANNLEEAVDVADSYGSIKDSTIKKIIVSQVKKNLEHQLKNNNKKGIVIYGLLNQIFMSFDSATKNNQDFFYDIPSVNSLTINELKNENGKINIQQFFYGDKDGKDFFNDFVNSFRNMGWRVISKPNWVEVVGNGNTPVTIYANRPLNESEGLDEVAQKKLSDYLDSLNIYPTIVIHRGHSYYVNSSIKQITAYAKLVLLGSCGGYHSLNKVLTVSPQAQIIASKQIGTGVINMAMIDLIMDNLKQGKDLNWQLLWRNLDTKFANRKELKERFDDYIPPYKNLGAIFIMAYNNATKKM